MAIANLAEGGCAGMFDSEEDRRAVLGTTVKILSHSIRGQNWAGIHFAPFSVVYPLSNLSQSVENRELLMECGLAEELARLISDWKEVGHHSDRTLGLALNIAEDMCDAQRTQRRLRDAGMLPVLEELAAMPEVAADAAFRLQVLRIRKALTDGHVAFMMGQHPRLGARSPLMLLDGLVMGKIAHLAFGCAAITPLAVPEDAEGAGGVGGSGGEVCASLEEGKSAEEDKRVMMLNAALARMERSGQAPRQGLRRMTTLL